MCSTHFGNSFLLGNLGVEVYDKDYTKQSQDFIFSKIPNKE